MDDVVLISTAQLYQHNSIQGTNGLLMSVFLDILHCNVIIAVSLFFNYNLTVAIKQHFGNSDERKSEGMSEGTQI